MTHQEMTKHIRQRIKKSGIQARVSLYTACGVRWVRIIPVSAELSWNGEEARQICLIAKVNGLRGVRNTEIDDSFARWNGSGATNFHFEFWG